MEPWHWVLVVCLVAAVLLFAVLAAADEPDDEPENMRGLRDEDLFSPTEREELSA